MDADVAVVEDVEVVGETDLTLMCRIRGRRVMVPRLQIDPRSTVRRTGDRGRLVVPRWLADDLGLV
jgi:hypothetical protein